MMDETERRCSTCKWWGTDADRYHDEDRRTCRWPRPFWMGLYSSHRENISSVGCETWEVFAAPHAPTPPEDHR